MLHRSGDNGTIRQNWRPPLTLTVCGVFHNDCGFPVEKLWKWVPKLMMVKDFALIALCLGRKKTGVISILIEIIHFTHAFVS